MARRKGCKVRWLPAAAPDQHSRFKAQLAQAAAMPGHRGHRRRRRRRKGK
jgi:hypothetical protein